MLVMDYQSRQKKFRTTLGEQKLDGYIVIHAANLRYLCGYTGSNGLLLFLDGQRIFFTDGRYTTQAREEVHGARVVIARGPLFPEAIKGISPRTVTRLGFEGDHTSVAAATQMRETSPR